ncbi:MAG: metallophosphoesterase [Kiritimatiellae bacterium]|nr:metallophosphoesterase [Kiritimatiellia bacterium]
MFDIEISRAAARIRELATTCPVGFFFLTDLHVPSNYGESAPLIARLISETGLRTVVSGGDIPEAFGDRASLDDSIARYRQNWVERIENAGGDFFPIRGNHDLAIRLAPDSNDGFTYPAEAARDIILDTAAVRARAKVDQGSCAYYVDFPEERFRLIATDTSDSVTTERTFWGVLDTMGESQILWLTENAIATIPDGWCAVAVSHIPFSGVAADDHDKASFAPLCAILAAYQARGQATVAGRTFDFSNAGGIIPLALSGHHHGELQSCVDGIWHVSEPCDAAYLDYINRSAPWCPDLPVKEQGTWAGQTFDVVQIDPTRGLVHFTRIGGGGDRTLHLAPLRLRVGESARLEARELGGGMVAWGAYDAYRATTRPNPARKYDRFTDYYNCVAAIEPEGTLRALAPGDAVAVARSASGTREYFPVKVEGEV